MACELNTAEFECVPVVLQDAYTEEIVTVGCMNRAAIETTLATRRATLLQRDTGRLQAVGESCGPVARVVEVRATRDHTALLIRIINAPMDTTEPDLGFTERIPLPPTAVLGIRR
jgi:phosphoribosyl-AMP cyclohydrolase